MILIFYLYGIRQSDTYINGRVESRVCQKVTLLHKSIY